MTAKRSSRSPWRCWRSRRRMRPVDGRSRRRADLSEPRDQARRCRLSAGGPLDIIARLVADKLSASLKQPFVIENRPGAGGNIGTEVVARAAPDGYTLGMVLGTTLTVNPSLYQEAPIRPGQGLAGRSQSIDQSATCWSCIRPSRSIRWRNSSPSRRPRPRGTSRSPMRSGGIGNPGHLAMENFRVHAGFDADPCALRGNPPMVVDLLAGQIKVAFITSAGMMDHVRAGD